MQSALYQGQVLHRRLSPHRHTFKYNLHLAYLDLSELEDVFAGHWLYSVGRPNLVQFKRSDYLGAHEQPLSEAVLDRVEKVLGRRPMGRVGVLTQLRTLGYLFNPVSFYFCHDEEGNLDSVAAEITNTPWGERHAYVLDAAACGDGKGAFHFHFDKGFHVSPFFPMEQGYRWSFSWGNEVVQVGMQNLEAGCKVFEVSLKCERRPITSRSLALALFKYPLQPLRMHAAIYWQAARLYLKRTPFFTHPKKQNQLSEEPLQ